MRKIALLFFVMYSLLSNAQVWCDSGAIWHYGFQTFDSDGYFRLSYVSDTIIGTTTCKKIHKEQVYYNMWSFGYDTISLGFEFTYANTDKVFLLRFGNFYTLYDFSSNVGDTLLVPGNNQYSGCDSVGFVRVDSVGITVINSQNLRYYTVSNLAGSNWGWNCRIVEKIGPVFNYSGPSLSYFLPCKLDACGLLFDEIKEGGTFRCYHDDNFSLFNVTSEACEHTLSIRTPIEINSLFATFPNPNSGQVCITTNINLPISYYITDITGRQLQSGQIITKQTSIQIKDKGIFNLVFISNNGITVNKKIVVE